MGDGPVYQMQMRIRTYGMYSKNLHAVVSKRYSKARPMLPTLSRFEFYFFLFKFLLNLVFFILLWEFFSFYFDSADNPEFTFMQEMSYIALLLIMICISIALVIYITRQWRYKKQQIRLRDFGCPPPQYQYKYIPTCPYDTSNSQQITTSEKASLAPV